MGAGNQARSRSPTFDSSGNMVLPGILTAGSASTVIVTPAGLLRHQAIDPDIAGSGLSIASGVLSVDAHAPAAHTIASHSDTTGTGAELDTLTDGSDASALHVHTIVSLDTTATGANLTSLTNDSMVDAFHRHSELSASDGSPSPVLTVNVTGLVGIGTVPSQKLDVNGSVHVKSNLYVGDDGAFRAIWLNDRTGGSTPETAANRIGEISNANSIFTLRALNNHVVRVGDTSNNGMTVANGGAVAFTHGVTIATGGLQVMAGTAKLLGGFGLQALSRSIAIDGGNDLRITDTDELILVTTGTTSTLNTIIGGYNGQRITLSLALSDTMTINHGASGAGSTILTISEAAISAISFRLYVFRKTIAGWIQEGGS